MLVVYPESYQDARPAKHKIIYWYLSSSGVYIILTSYKTTWFVVDICLTMERKGLCSFETSVTTSPTTQPNIPADFNLQ